MHVHRLIAIICLTGLSVSFVSAQKQLVVLKGERVLLRLYPGDEIVYKLKKSKKIKTSYVNNLSDTAVVMHRDTVPFHTIDRIYFKQHKFYNKIGTLLVIGAAGYFLVDQFNVGIVQGTGFNLDSSVSTVTLTGLAVGLPMMLIHKRSQRLGYRSRVMTVKSGSAFYMPNPKGYMMSQ